MNINFSGVEQPEERPQAEYVRPGVGIFTIDKIDYIEPAREGGNPALDIFFKKENSEASFKERFFLSQAALPRLQYLKAKVTGTPFEGELSLEQINSALISRSVRLIVDGNEVRGDDGKIRTYCKLRFSGFAESIDDKENWKLNDEMVRIEKAPEPAAGFDASAGKDDLPF